MTQKDKKKAFLIHDKLHSESSHTQPCDVVVEKVEAVCELIIGTFLLLCCPVVDGEFLKVEQLNELQQHARNFSKLPLAIIYQY